jgi:hypothetical protein
VAEIPKRLYLAGPMSGIAQFNFPMFNDVAGRLRALGFEVFNPAENPDNGRQPRSYYMRLDIPALLASEAVVLLPGWRESRGANLEVWIAADTELPLYEYAAVDGEVTLEHVPAPQLPCLPFLKSTGGRS